MHIGIKLSNHSVADDVGLMCCLAAGIRKVKVEQKHTAMVIEEPLLRPIHEVPEGCSHRHDSDGSAGI